MAKGFTDPLCWGWRLLLGTMVPNLFGTRDKFSPTCGGGGFGMIQAHYIYCALHFYYYYIGSISDDPASGPRGWGPLPGGP